MVDREKVIKGLRVCISPVECSPDDCPYYIHESGICWDNLMIDVLALLKDQDERGKTICKEICDFIRGSCCTDTDADKEYVCHVVQQIFIKGWR